MWDEDWARLGIEPTTQLAAIKKAYAVKLKVTRPDDDAQAYQALRAAYERAQQWAAWARAEAEQGREVPLPAGPAADAPDAPVALTPEPAAPPVDVPDLTPPPSLPVPLPAVIEGVAAPAVDPAPAPVLEPAPPLQAAPLAPAAAPEAEPAGAAPWAPPAPAEPELPPPPPAVRPEALIERLEQVWRRQGPDALMAAWQDVRRELDEQPLARRAEFSAAFAEWLVRQSRLPDRLAVALDAHFEWTGDFRTERLIGAPLTHAVQTALAERIPRPVDPALRAAAEPLLRVAALREARRWALLPLILLMMQPALARLLNGLPAGELRRLGLELPDQQWLAEQVKRGQWLRVGVFSLLVLGVAWLNAGDGVVATAHMVTWIGCMALLLAGGIFLGAFLNTGPTLRVGERRWALPLSAWRQHAMQPVLGLVWLLFAAWLAYMTMQPTADLRAAPVLVLLPDWAWGLASFGFGLAGLMVAWPLEPLHGLVLAGLAWLVSALFEAALGAWMPYASSLCIGAAWALAGAAVYAGRLAPPDWTRWLLRPVMNSLVLAERWTFGMATLPMSAALAWQIIQDGHARATTLFAIWALGLLAVAWLQTRLETLAQRWLPALPPAAADEDAP